MVAQVDGITPVIVVMDNRAASESAMDGLFVPATISEKEGPKGLAAVFTRIHFQLSVKTSVFI